VASPIHSITLGSLTRAARGFGPSFAERALTSGRGKVSVGFGYQHAAYDTFEGLNLRQRGTDGITFYIPHADCCSPGAAQASTPDNSRLTPPFEGDLIEAQLSLRLATDSSILFANYGVSNRLDIGVAVPFVRSRARRQRAGQHSAALDCARSTLHAFGANPDQRPFRMSGVASGLGDIMLRAKCSFTPGRAAGLAAAVEARVPTGDEATCSARRGAGSHPWLLPRSIAARSTHFNAGYTFSVTARCPARR
jgi:hypothetical protein